jgi:hypothetical protein
VNGRYDVPFFHLVGQLAMSPVIDGSARFFGWFTGDSNDPNDLFRGEGSRCPGSVVIVEDVLDQAEQLLLGSVVLLGLQQSGSGQVPTVAPEADGYTRQVELSGHGFDARVGSQGEQHNNSADQALASRLTVAELLEQGLLGRSNLERCRTGSAHGLTRSSASGRFTQTW